MNPSKKDQSQGSVPAAKPIITAVVAVRNEVRHIEACLKSVLYQETRNFALEVLVVDGGSTDGTLEIIERLTRGRPNVSILHNENRKAPFAFNLGVQHAKGKYVCIMGAHSVYADDYISVCLEQLRKHGAVGCSGCLITRPGSNTLQAKLIAWALSHAFGTSTHSTRTHPPGFADTIPYPVFLKSALVEVGGYDTNLHRNQDNDLNQRLRSRGHKLYLTDLTSCEYYPSASFSVLISYAFRTGYWNWVSFKQNYRSMAFRHFVPFAFVLSFLGGLVSFLVSWYVTGPARVALRAPLVFTCVAYLVAGLIATLQVGLRTRSFQAAFLLPVFFVLHTSYGLGTFWSVVTNAGVSEKAAGREGSVLTCS